MQHRKEQKHKRKFKKNNKMMSKKELLKAYNNVLKLDRLLSGALNTLSEAASAYAGTTLQADICGGGEIEFRQVDERGYANDFSTLRLEELLGNANI